MKITKFLKYSYASLAFFLFQIQTSFADIMPTKQVCDTKNGCQLVDDPASYNSLSYNNFISTTAIFLASGLIIEIPIFYFLGIKSKKTILAVFLSNLITVTALTFLLFYLKNNIRQFLGNSELLIIYFGSTILGIILLKTILFKIITKTVSWKRSFLVSLLASTISISFELFILLR